MKEQTLWQAWADAGRGEVIEDRSGVHPDGDWYLSIGQGMGAAITMADEKRCVTLSDLGTALFRAETVSLDLQRYNDEIMLNPYSIIPLDGPHAAEAEALRAFMVGEARPLIEAHTVSGEPMFTAGQPWVSPSISAAISLPSSTERPAASNNLRSAIRRA